MTLKRGRVEARLCGSQPSGYDHISSRAEFQWLYACDDVTYSAFRMRDDGRSGTYLRADFTGELKYILSRDILSIGIALP